MHTTPNTIGRAVAIATGAMATAGALTLLCQDVWFGQGSWTVNHFLLPLVIVIAIVAGWLAEHTIRRREWLYTLPLLFVFALASFLTVYQSVGGQKEKASVKASSAETHNDAIRDTRAAIVRAEKERALAADMLRGAERALQAQCVDGRKSKGHCDGIRATISTYRGSEKGHGLTVQELQAKLQTLGGEHVARPKAEALGDLAAAFGYDRKATVAIATTLEPYGFPFLFEAVAILCFGYGFRPARREQKQRFEITPEPGPALVAQPSKASNSERRASVHSFVAAHVARHGQAPRITDVQAFHVDRFGFEVPKASAARWRTEAIELVQPVVKLRVVGG